MILLFVLNLAALAEDVKVNDQFYQLDYRERLSAEAKLPVIGGFEIQASFETRYRPKKIEKSQGSEKKQKN